MVRLRERVVGLRDVALDHLERHAVPQVHLERAARRYRRHVHHPAVEDVDARAQCVPQALGAQPVVGAKAERPDAPHHRGAHREPHGLHLVALVRGAVQEEVFRVVREPAAVPRPERPDPLRSRHDEAHDREHRREGALAQSGEELDDEAERAREHVGRNGEGKC